MEGINCVPGPMPTVAGVRSVMRERQSSAPTPGTPSPTGRRLPTDAWVARRNPCAPAMEQRGAGKPVSGLPDLGEQGEEGRRDGNAGGQPPARSALPAWTTRGQRRTALPPRQREASPQQRPVRWRGSVGQVQPQVWSGGIEGMAPPPRATYSGLRRGQPLSRWAGWKEFRRAVVVALE